MRRLLAILAARGAGRHRACRSPAPSPEGDSDYERRRRLRRLARPARRPARADRGRASGQIDDVTLTRDYKARVHTHRRPPLRPVPRGRDVHHQALRPDRGELRPVRPGHAGRARAEGHGDESPDRARREHDAARQPHRPVRGLERADPPAPERAASTLGIATSAAARTSTRSCGARTRRSQQARRMIGVLEEQRDDLAGHRRRRGRRGRRAGRAPAAHSGLVRHARACRRQTADAARGARRGLRRCRGCCGQAQPALRSSTRRSPPASRCSTS